MNKIAQIKYEIGELKRQLIFKYGENNVAKFKEQHQANMFKFLNEVVRQFSQIEQTEEFKAICKDLEIVENELAITESDKSVEVKVASTTVEGPSTIVEGTSVESAEVVKEENQTT